MLDGKEGNDYIDGGAGTLDTLMGGAGNDILIDMDGFAKMDSGDGDDHLQINYLAASTSSLFAITGGSGSDRIDVNMNHAAFVVKLYADVNSTTVKGGSDDVRLTGTYASSEIYLGGGTNRFTGGIGNDTVSSLEGNDLIDTAAGNDSVTAGLGNDTIYGGAGNDTLNGGDGNDLLIGQTGIGDQLLGGNGDDTLRDDDGVFAAHGGSGNDKFDITFLSTWDNDANGGTAPLANNIITGGFGSDSLYITMNSATFTLNLNADSLTPSLLKADVLGNDTVNLEGTYLRSNIDLSGGNDKFLGGTFADSVLGGLGNDTLTGDAGNDSLYGGVGDDVIEGSAGFGDMLYGEDGNDQISDLDGVWAAHGGNGIDNLNISYRSNWVNASNAALSDSQISGGAGNDTIKINASNANLLLKVNGDNSNSIETTLDGADRIFITGYYSRATIDGGAGIDSISGGDGIDIIYGGSGNDRIDGNFGADSLYGGAGDDYLEGGVGTDRFEGGAGKNTMRGGADADTFIIGNTASANTILDFEEVDVINLSAYALGVTATTFNVWLGLVATASGSATILTFDADDNVRLNSTLLSTLDFGDFAF